MQSEVVVKALSGTISNTSISLADLGFTVAELAAADYLEITVSQPIRYRTDGGDPDSTTGFFMASNGRNRMPSTGGGKDWLPDLRFIRADVSDAFAFITLLQL